MPIPNNNIGGIVSPPIATWFGFNVPFYDGQQSVLPRQTDQKLIKNDLLQLILTIPGERVYRPDFGTIVRSVVFEVYSNSLASQLRTSIINAIQNYEERVTVNSVAVTAGDSDNTLVIVIDVSLNGDPLTHYFIELGLGPNGQVQVLS